MEEASFAKWLRRLYVDWIKGLPIKDKRSMVKEFRSEAIYFEYLPNTYKITEDIIDMIEQEGYSDIKIITQVIVGYIEKYDTGMPTPNLELSFDDGRIVIDIDSRRTMEYRWDKNRLSVCRQIAECLF